MWVAVSDDAERQTSESFATHYLTGEDGSKHMPLFTTEEKTKAYIGARNLAIHSPAPIHDPADLVLRLKPFRARGGNCVRIDDSGREGDEFLVCNLGIFIEYVEGHT